VCNVLDLHGGGWVVDGACSSSLLAVATAAELIASGQLDIALCGGVDVSLDPFELVGFAKATALSAGDMNVYDKRGKGFIPGEGCGVVVLQRLDHARRDGHPVLAQLRGWGISSDGKGGITAPSARGQALALRRAYERAGYSPHSLDFVEGHGTGTAVGDRVELEGISEAVDAFGEKRSRSIGVTSFKSIVGHTKAAAGIGGFIKAVLAVNQRVVPPTAGCVEPHTVFGERARALYPVLRGEQRPLTDRLRAGVSAMGFGGINSHVTLESGDAPDPAFALGRDPSTLKPWESEVFPIAAPSREALLAAAQALSLDAAGISVAELGDLAIRTAARLGQGPCRAAVVASSPDELVAALGALLVRLQSGEPLEIDRKVGLFAGARATGEVDAAPRVGFLFPGQGSQLLGMAGGLLDRYAWARELAAEADGWVAGFPAFQAEPLSAFMQRPTWRDPAGESQAEWKAALTRTEVAQPAIALASLLWFELLRRVGLSPAVTGGHSLGELMALCASGAFDAATLLQIAALRGQAMAAPAADAGTMAALVCDPALALSLLEGTAAVLANRNSPEQCVVSGTLADVERVVERAAAAGLRARRLTVSNAFHSPLVAAAAAQVAADPRVPRRAAGLTTTTLSCTDGAPFSADADLRAHLGRQITAPVDFIRLAAAMAESADLLIEVGPGRVLSGLVERCAVGRACLPAEGQPGRDRDAALLFAEAFTRGCDLSWSALYEGRFARPFVPARELHFYENPCERPFARVVLPELQALPRALRLRPGGRASGQLGELVTLLSTALSATHVAIYVSQASSLDLLSALPERSRRSLPSGQGIVAQVLAAGLMRAVPLLAAEPGFRPEVDGWPATLLQGALYLPVPLEAGTAVVMVARSGAEPFTEADQRTLSALAGSARPFIGQAHLELQVENAHALEAKLRGWATEIERDQPVSTLIESWIEAAVSSYGTEAGSLFLYDRRREELVSVAAVAPGEKGSLRAVTLRFPANRGIAGHVLTTGEDVHIDDAYGDPRFNPAVDKQTGFRTRTIDCMALVDDAGQAIGVLQLLNRDDRRWGPAERDGLRRLATQLSALLRLSKLVEGVQGSVEAPAAAPAEGAASAGSAASAAGAPRALLYGLVTRLTGFALDSLHGGLRLLDDLNLDSIKAGSLLAELGKGLGLPPGKLEGLANGTLDEILGRVGGSATDAAALEAKLYALVEERTGFARSTLHGGLRLLDDLNLDSIKAGSLLAELSKAAGLSAAPEGLANASLSDILARLQPSAAAEVHIQDPLPPAWVRDFTVSWSPAPLLPPPLPPMGEAEKGDGAGLLVVSDSDDALRVALQAALPAARFSDDETSGINEEGGPVRHLVVLAPTGPPDVERDVRRLAVTHRLREGGLDGALAAITFVQRGDGRMGQQEPEGGHHLGLRAFAASVSQDRPGLIVRALDLHRHLSDEAALQALGGELRLPRSGAAGVDALGARLEPALHTLSAKEARGAVALPGPGELILVTGGAKGITAECALALGRETGARFVLIGSSAAEPGGEVEGTLRRFAEAGLLAEYRRCDVGDAGAVTALVAAVQAERGPIVGFIHGAGLNKPRPAEQVPAEAALREIRPKLLGATHFLAALESAPPRLIIGLTSIIGVVGMPGNAWYAFSNERLDLALRDFAARHPGTHAVSHAWSVWDEVGMGVKLGSVDHLAQKGISAIPVEEGLRHFLRWVKRSPPDTQVVMTSRLGGLGAAGGSLPDPGRYTGSPRAFTPGVEWVSRVRLSADTDRFVYDHDFKGSLLFPTVYGLEAMGQAVLAVTGRPAFGDTRIEDIELSRPIVVHPTEGVEIELRALVREAEEDGSTVIVEAAIHVSTSGFSAAHFSARFVLDAPAPASEPAPAETRALDLLPADDLYSGLLFQGPCFQRIRRVLSLDQRAVTYETEWRDSTLSAPEGFSEAARRPLVLGDPYHRDTLLQAAQLVVTPEVALPVRIDCIELAAPSRRAPGPALARSCHLGREGAVLLGEVEAWDADGQLVERILGYRLRVLERDERLPDVARLLNPEAGDTVELQSRLDGLAASFGRVAPRVALLHRRGLHGISREARRLVTGPLLGLAAERAGLSGEPRWEDSGRPILSGAEGAGISLAHDEATCLAVAGSGPQGCDLVQAVTHPAEHWGRMLSRNAGVYGRLRVTEGVDRAGRLIWAAQEAAMKALGTDAARLDRERGRGGGWIFEAHAPDGSGSVDVLALVVRLARGGDRVVAAVVPRPAPSVSAPRESAPVAPPPAAPIAPRPTPSTPGLPAADEARDGHGMQMRADGPEGQLCFHQPSMVVFKEASEPSGVLRPSHLFRRMGELRELAARPVLDNWVADFRTGRWGAVTNYSRLHLLGTAETGDTLEGRVWSSGLSGPMDATIELRFAWDRVSASGERGPVAEGSMATTWVEITGHGEAKVAPNPPYFQAFAERIGPPTAAPVAPMPEPPAFERGPLVYEAARRPGRQPIHRSRFQTSREHSNIVGNIYFAHYPTWQGEAVDQMLNRLDPSTARDRSGELRLQRAGVEHYREAMPFDEIEVAVHVDELHAQGLKLTVELFRATGGGPGEGGSEKLAVGQVEGVWFAPEGAEWRPAPFPPQLAAGLRRGMA
jgi:acyl transferase domain-containing protein/acyl-CoA thioesterase FadM